MKITLVKKILTDGTPCRKCVDVLQKLENSGHMNRIDQVITADTKDPDSEGVRLAKKFNVNRAPFFLVEEMGKETRVFTVYLKFVKEVLEHEEQELEGPKSESLLYSGSKLS